MTSNKRNYIKRILHAVNPERRMYLATFQQLNHGFTGTQLARAVANLPKVIQFVHEGLDLCAVLEIVQDDYTPDYYDVTTISDLSDFLVTIDYCRR